MRLLPTVRLSLENDESTSPERQMARMQTHAQLHDHALVPVGPEDYDLGVSGSVPPWDRPGLGKWLKEDRLGAWDGLIVAKLDRLTRLLLDFERLVKWLQERGKTLVCIDPAIDLTTPAGRAFAQVIVVFAEFERETIRARTREAYDKLLKDGKYTGGQLKFGYMPVKLARELGDRNRSRVRAGCPRDGRPLRPVRILREHREVAQRLGRSLAYGRPA